MELPGSATITQYSLPEAPQEDEMRNKNSKTSVTRTLMARLPRIEFVFSPYEILPIPQENKYLVKFSYFIMKLYVVCTHWNRLEVILMSTHNIPLL